MQESEIREILRSEVERAGSQAAFADKHKISRQYLSDALIGRRSIGAKILNAIGFIRVVEFKRKAIE